MRGSYPASLLNVDGSTRVPEIRHGGHLRSSSTSKAEKSPYNFNSVGAKEYKVPGRIRTHSGEGQVIVLFYNNSSVKNPDKGQSEGLSDVYTVKLVNKDHSRERQHMVFIGKWSVFEGCFVLFHQGRVIEG